MGLTDKIKNFIAPEEDEEEFDNILFEYTL